MKTEKEIKEKSKIKIYCKNPSCFTHYLVNNKMKSEKEIKEEHNIAFKEEVLENKMFDDYDKNIIRVHLSNFYCVFQLGWDRANKNHEKGVEDNIDEKIDKIVDGIDKHWIANHYKGNIEEFRLALKHLLKKELKKEILK